MGRVKEMRRAGGFSSAPQIFNPPLAPVNYDEVIVRFADCKARRKRI
jgi:hypothetical protein